MECSGVFKTVFAQASQEHPNPVLCPVLSLDDHQGQYIHRETKAEEHFSAG